MWSSNWMTTYIKLYFNWIITHLFLFLIFSAWGELIYSITICFHRLLQSHPRKKLCTFLIFLISSLSSSRLKLLFGVNLHSRFNVHNYIISKNELSFHSLHHHSIINTITLSSSSSLFLIPHFLVSLFPL